MTQNNRERHWDRIIRETLKGVSMMVPGGTMIDSVCYHCDKCTSVIVERSLTCGNSCDECHCEFCISSVAPKKQMRGDP